MSKNIKSKDNKLKSKDIAILLAFMFGIFAWIYTYKRDRTKFWVNIALAVLSFGFWAVSFGWLWAIVDAIRRPRSFYGDKKIKKVPYFVLVFMGILGLLITGLCVFSLVKINNEIEAQKRRLAADPITTQNFYIALNKQRTVSGAQALAILPELTNAAAQKCSDMVTGNYFDYKNPSTGKDANSFITENQGNLYFKNYVASISQAMPAQTATDFINKLVSDQASNLNNPIYNSVGLSICDSPDRTNKYIVGMLAEKAEKPAPPPQVINNYYKSPSPTYRAPVTTNCTLHEYTYFNDTISCSSY